MRLNDTLSGLLLLVFSAVIVVYAWRFPEIPGQNMGPGLFPILIGVGLALCGLTLTWAGRTPQDTAWLVFEDWVRRPRMVLNAALVIGGLIFYALVVDTVGFFLTAFVFLVVLFLGFGVSRRWIAPIAAAVTFGLHVAFYTLLRVPLPWGWLEGIAW
jgi:putative tricarboxylic transport membrane protein